MSSFMGSASKDFRVESNGRDPLRYRNVSATDTSCESTPLPLTLTDVFRPVIHKNVIYNCRVIIYNGEILHIRPKMWMANNGNYRELRYFTPWQKHRQVEDHYLPRIVHGVTGQVSQNPLTTRTIIDCSVDKSSFWRRCGQYGRHMHRGRAM